MGHKSNGPRRSCVIGSLVQMGHVGRESLGQIGHVTHVGRAITKGFNK